MSARAWAGDWKQRIGDFARREGHPNLWEYLRAHPGEPLPEIAARIGDAAPLQLRDLVVAECLARRDMPTAIRDLLARSIRQHLPRGWGTAEGDQDIDALDLGSLPRPYAELARKLGHRLRDLTPAEGWLPASGDDQTLRHACENALTALTEEQRELISRGETKPRPGDAWWAKVEPVWKEISIYDGPETFLEQFARVQPGIGHLYATHWCRAEVSNGGFSQFFSNSTGVLAPEALAGFTALGMPRAAELVARAMAIFPSPYPRDRYQRATAKPEAAAKQFDALDRPFWDVMDTEAGGLDVAADRHAEDIDGSPFA